MAVNHVGRLHIVVHIEFQEYLGQPQSCEARWLHTLSLCNVDCSNGRQYTSTCQSMVKLLSVCARRLDALG